MNNLSYIGLSRQVGLWKQMEITANNMANMDTAGYKAEKISFQEYISDKATGEKEKSISQVSDGFTYKDMSQGSMHQTHNTLDAAINGDGFFAIQTAGGTRYTRDGSFGINPSGELVTQSGDKVLSTGGSPIIVPEGSTEIVIAKNGSISTSEGEIGKLKVVKFADDKGLTAIGNNLFASSAAEQPIEYPMIEQGMIEGSNVEPINEMTNMIQIQRMFEATQNMLDEEHSQQRTMIKTLTEV